eukprot:4860039-Pyramimonas_sp.AAC.1
MLPITVLAVMHLLAVVAGFLGVGPNYSHDLQSGSARALSEFRESSDLFKGTDVGDEFLLMAQLGQKVEHR